MKKAIPLIVLALLLSACETPEIVRAMNGAVVTVNVASILVSQSPSLDAATKASTVAYLAATNAALTAAAANIKDGKITPQGAAAFSAAIAAAVLPTLPADAPTDLRAALAAVPAAVKLFVSLLPQTSAPVTLRLSPADREVIDDALSQARATGAVLARERMTD